MGWTKGMKHSEESKSLMRARKHSVETREKMSAALTGRKQGGGRSTGYTHSEETKQRMKDAARTKGRKAWNAGLTKADPRVAKNSESLAKSLQQKVADGVYTPPTVTPEIRAATALRMSQNNPGGRCRWYDVAGERVQGTWERDLALKMIELGVPWLKRGRGNRSWNYLDAEGCAHRYTPDFYLPGVDLQLEVKGFWWGQDRDKMNRVLFQNSTRVHIVTESQFHSLLAATDSTEFLALITG